MTRVTGWRRGVILVGLSAVGWSSSGWFARMAPVDPLTMAGWRGFFSVLALLVYFAVARRGETRWRLGRAGWAVATVSTLSTLGFMSALALTSVATVSIIHATSPFLAGALAWVVLGDQPMAATLAAACLALVGVAVMVGGDLSVQGLGGMACAFVMTMGMAVITVISRRHRGVSMLPATCVSALQLAVIGLVFARPFSVPAEDVAILAVFGVTQAASFAFYIEGARFLAPASSALIAATDVPLSPLWVWLAFNETPLRATVIGGALIVAAILFDVLANLKRA